MQTRETTLFHNEEPQRAAIDCATKLCKQITVLAQNRTQILIALCGGSSPNHLYHALSTQIPSLEESILSKLRFIPLDERAVATENPQHNLQHIKAALLTPLIECHAITPEQIYWFYLQEDIKSSIAAFQAQFEQNTPHIDIAIAGSGEDGHIASLFPTHPSVHDASSAGFIQVDNSPKPPAQRVSASRTLILSAPLCIGIFLKGKEQAYANFNSEALSIEECPAKLLRFHSNAESEIPAQLFVITDLASTS